MAKKQKQLTHAERLKTKPEGTVLMPITLRDGVGKPTVYHAYIGKNPKTGKGRIVKVEDDDGQIINTDVLRPDNPRCLIYDQAVLTQLYNMYS
jgi:hypothetical protein